MALCDIICIHYIYVGGGGEIITFFVAVTPTMCGFEFEALELESILILVVRYCTIDKVPCQ